MMKLTDWEILALETALDRTKVDFNTEHGKKLLRKIEYASAIVVAKHIRTGKPVSPEYRPRVAVGKP